MLPGSDAISSAPVAGWFTKPVSVPQLVACLPITATPASLQAAESLGQGHGRRKAVGPVRTMSTNNTGGRTLVLPQPLSTKEVR